MGGGDSEYDVQLNLVPLIDILTNILFFLLVGFASTELKYEGNLMLPSASVNAKVKPGVEMQLSKEQLIVEDVAVAKIAGGNIEADMEGDKVLPLYEKLNAVRKARKEVGGAAQEDVDVIWLLADREIPFSVLSPVMKTAALAGYPNFRFAVVKE